MGEPPHDNPAQPFHHRLFIHPPPCSFHTHNLSSSNSTPPSQQRIRSNFIGTIPNNPLAFSILIPSLSLSPLLKREREKLTTHLDKPDILRLLSERLATHV
jgi:hypothetical protein